MHAIPEDTAVDDIELGPVPPPAQPPPSRMTERLNRPSFFNRTSVVGVRGAWHSVNRLMRTSINFRSNTNIAFDPALPLTERMQALRRLEERLERDPTRVILRQALQKSRESSYNSVLDGVATETLIVSERLFDWFTPRRHGERTVVITPLICLACWTIFMYMAGATTASCSALVGPAGPRSLLEWLHGAQGECQTFSSDYLQLWGGRYAPSQSWYSWLTTAFVHEGFLHIFPNLSLFLLLGSEIEARYGSLRFAALWLVTTLGGSLLAGVAGDRCTVVVGLSGSVFGLMGLFIIDLAKNWRTVGQPLLRLAAFVALLVVLGVTFLVQPKGVSHFSHIGGLLTGLFPSLLLQQHFLEPRVWLQARAIEKAECAAPILAITFFIVYFLALALQFYLHVLPKARQECPGILN